MNKVNEDRVYGYDCDDQKLTLMCIDISSSPNNP